MPGDITVVIPSCDRVELLAATLRCLEPHVARHRMCVLIGENARLGPTLRAAVDAARERIPGVDFTLLDLTEPAGPPGRRRMLEAVDSLYGHVETPYIFHCEDDWWLSPDDFVTPSRAILEARPEVTIVRLTGDERPPYPERGPPVEVRKESGEAVSFRYARYGGPGGAYGAFTFHPGLRRKADYERHFGSYRRYGAEAEISRRGQALGHREAILPEVAARHAGEGEGRSRLGHSEAEERATLGKARAFPAGSRLRTRLDAGHRGVYHLYDVGVRLGARPTLLFFDDDAQVPQALADDRALQTWLACEASSTLPALDHEARGFYAQGVEPVYLLHELANPQHVLHDVLFSTALDGLAPGAKVPAFSAYVRTGVFERQDATTSWGRLVHEAAGLVSPRGELFAGSATGRVVCFQHLIVPRFMRHRSAHAWASHEGAAPRHHVDTSTDYPLEVLEALRRRLVAGVLGQELAPWSEPVARDAAVLVLDRGETTRRRWTNAHDALAELRRHFDAVDHRSADYGLLAPAAQAALFHAARVVIAPHGGALANLVFCRPGPTCSSSPTKSAPSVGPPSCLASAFDTTRCTRRRWLRTTAISRPHGTSSPRPSTP